MPVIERSNPVILFSRPAYFLNKKSTFSTGSTQSTTTTNHNTSESKKTTTSSGGLDSYDAGYDDIYMDGDYAFTELVK